MESLVKILGAFLDTLVLNVYPTDHAFEIEERRVDPLLQEELMLLKEQAQELEEDVPTRFAFNGAPLLMRAKGGDGFNWIMHNHWLTVAVNRSSKAQILGQVRCSSAYLWQVRDLSQIIVDVHQFLMSIFGEYIPTRHSCRATPLPMKKSTIEVDAPAQRSLASCACEPDHETDPGKRRNHPLLRW